MTTGDPESQFFAGHPHAWQVYRKVRSMVRAVGPARVVVSRSQIAFRRARGFAYVWLPGRWLRRPTAEVVLSIALDRMLESPRFKQVVHPSRTVWMHHLEVGDVAELDAEVQGWLRQAYDAAGVSRAPRQG